MQTISLPRLHTDRAWRDAARGLLAAGTRPEAVIWRFDDAPQHDLFGAPAETAPPPASGVTVPKSFIAMADTVVWHADPERFARLYAFLWRLRDVRGLMEDRGDADLARLRQMEKNVRRCAHKMKAFVRFRDLAPDGNGRRRFAAWFEPTHHTVEPTAPFFARRFADMDWIIATPDVTARHEAGRLSFTAGDPKPDLPEDGAEELWGTYFRNIFNPARVKVKAMTSEMPRKYWKNLPEARHIPDLLATADARARDMAAAAPTLPPVRAARILTRLHEERDSPMTFDDLRARAKEENRQTTEGYGRIVLGEGPVDARLMVVGEQPGDVEDQQGRPFVGPAGQMFDRTAAEAGLDRQSAYVTNSVKRFKFVQRGKRRMHQAPNRGDIDHAKWWIKAEIEIVRPKLILGMGGTAAEALTGKRAGLLKRRGQIEETEFGPVFLTMHPAYILRLPDTAAQDEARDLFRRDLTAAAAMVA